MTCIRTLGWNRAFELHRLMKKIHRSIMDKLFFVSVCVHTSNCSNPNKKQVKYKHSHYRNEKILVKYIFSNGNGFFPFT